MTQTEADRETRGYKLRGDPEKDKERQGQTGTQRKGDKLVATDTKSETEPQTPLPHSRHGPLSPRAPQLPAAFLPPPGPARRRGGLT